MYVTSKLVLLSEALSKYSLVNAEVIVIKEFAYYFC